MGKYNRQTNTKKLQKLTAKIETVKPEQVILPSARKGGKNTAAKKMLKKLEKKVVAATVAEVDVKKEMPKPKAKTAPRVAEVEVTDFKISQTPEQLKEMNVFQKLTLARSIVGDMQLKKSGANSDAGFNYFELADFVPILNKLAEHIGIMPMFRMTNELGTLKVVNTDKPTEVAEFYIPTADLVMADAEGNKAEGIQVLGGKTTYLRRYLYQIAFEISVKDTVDNRPKTPAKPIEELDARDIETINEASDVENLNAICQNIRQRKGFKKHQALLKHYTEAKEKL